MIPFSFHVSGAFHETLKIFFCCYLKAFPGFSCPTALISQSEIETATP